MIGGNDLRLQPWPVGGPPGCCFHSRGMADLASPTYAHLREECLFMVHELCLVGINTNWAEFQLVFLVRCTLYSAEFSMATS